jgi:hypothetical protein
MADISNYYIDEGQPPQEMDVMDEMSNVVQYGAAVFDPVHDAMHRQPNEPDADFCFLCLVDIEADDENTRESDSELMQGIRAFRPFLQDIWGKYCISKTIYEIQKYYRINIMPHFAWEDSDTNTVYESPEWTAESIQQHFLQHASTYRSFQLQYHVETCQSMMHIYRTTMYDAESKKIDPNGAKDYMRVADHIFKLTQSTGKR